MTRVTEVGRQRRGSPADAARLTDGACTKIRLACCCAVIAGYSHCRCRGYQRWRNLVPLQQVRDGADLAGG